MFLHYSQETFGLCNLLRELEVDSFDQRRTVA